MKAIWPKPKSATIGIMITWIEFGLTVGAFGLVPHWHRITNAAWAGTAARIEKTRTARPIERRMQITSIGWCVEARFRFRPLLFSEELPERATGYREGNVVPNRPEASGGVR